MRCEAIRWFIYNHVMLCVCLCMFKTDVFIVVVIFIIESLGDTDEVNHLIYGVCNVNHLKRNKFCYLFLNPSILIAIQKKNRNVYVSNTHVQTSKHLVVGSSMILMDSYLNAYKLSS